MTRRTLMVSCVLGGALLATLALSQTSYDERWLAVKKRFAANEIAAIAEPFRGVATSSGIEQGLFSIRASGVSTDPIREDATSFLSTLTEEQQIRTVFSVDAPEWRRWSNVDNGIYVRQGVSLEDMTDDQKDAAWGLLQSSLSPKGLALSRNIMKTDQTLLELNEDTLSFGEEKYFFTMMGLPSPGALGLAARRPSSGDQLLRPRRSGRDVAGLPRR